MRRGVGGGFTLVELIVVVLIIGILTAFAIPQYMRTVEKSKADDAIAVLKMVGTVNRMFAMDNSNSFAVGTLATSCNTPSTSCPLGNASNVCNLVICKYLSPEDWENRPYVIVAGNGSVAATDCGSLGLSGLPSRNYVACVKRRDNPAPPGTKLAPYSTWGFALDINGKIEAAGTDAPQPLGL